MINEDPGRSGKSDGLILVKGKQPAAFQSAERKNISKIRLCIHKSFCAYTRQLKIAKLVATSQQENVKNKNLFLGQILSKNLFISKI